MKRERIKLDPNNPIDMQDAKEKVKRASRTLRLYTSREVQERARQASIDAVDSLWAIIKSQYAGDQAKIAAANTILDRAHGRPHQTNINANVNSDAPTKDLDGKSLDKRIKEVLARVNEIESGAGKAEESSDGPPDLRKLN